MSNNPSTNLTQDAIAKSLRKTFGEEAIDALARSSGFMRRKRDITPLMLLGACISTLAISKVQWLADIHRAFNEMADKPVSYKPFHNQISKPAFAEFMRLTLEMMLQNLSMPVFECLPQHKLTMFTDIWIHDG